MACKTVIFSSFDSFAEESKILPKRKHLPNQHVSWLIGKQAYTLPFTEQTKYHLSILGSLCSKYHQAIEDIYFNRSEYASRINLYRDHDFIENVSRAFLLSSRQVFYRPDLIISDNLSFRIVEIDALPGEIGVNCFLRDAYGLSATPIISAFHSILKEWRLSSCIDFVIDTVKSEDEYVAEYSYLANLLRTVGIHFNIYNIQNYSGPKEQKTMVYRFFDMVHNDQVQIRKILDKIQETESVLYPPLKHYLEEKLSLSCVHDKEAEALFLKFFSHEELHIFRQLLPKVHYLDKKTQTIHPILEFHETQVSNFDDLIMQAPNIPYVLKTSAFSDHASTSKGAKLLEGVSKNEMSKLLKEHIHNFKEHFILQEKVNSLSISTEILKSDGTAAYIKGFSRLTPFYFARGKAFDYTSAHIVIRESDIDVHFASNATVIPAL